MASLHITNENFEEVLSKGLPVVLDFSATWCGPCKKVGPIIDKVADEFDGKAIVGKVDIEECEDLAAEYGIRNIPTVLFIKDGKVADKVVGAASKDIYVTKLSSIL